MIGMGMQEFKPENVGETRIVITSGLYKGYTVVVRTAVSNVIFEEKYEDDEKEKPIFRVTHRDSLFVIPPQVDIKKGKG